VAKALSVFSALLFCNRFALPLVDFPCCCPIELRHTPANPHDFVDSMNMQLHRGQQQQRLRDVRTRAAASALIRTPLPNNARPLKPRYV
jgi:hypothetical protein